MENVKSVLQDRKECYICRTTYGLHKHHVFEGTGRRSISEAEGCWIYLCGPHHNLSNTAIHYNKRLDLMVKAECQRAWMEKTGKTASDFTRRFGRNYLEAE